MITENSNFNYDKDFLDLKFRVNSEFVHKLRNIRPILNDKEIIELAFSTSSKIEEKDAKKQNILKIQNIVDKTNNLLNQYVFDFELEYPDFYEKIIENFYPFKNTKRVISNVKWMATFLNKLKKDHTRLLKNLDERALKNKKLYFSKIKNVQISFYGRYSSLIKSKKTELNYLKEYRTFLRSLPKLKPEFTISLLGYPNVGKSSFLTNTTGSTPEIANYAFTTKKLMVGFIKLNDIEEIQIIDCPGTLDKNFEDMNAIEKQSLIALKYVTHKAIYIIDPISDLKKQINLMNYINNNLKKIDFVLINKIDLMDKEEIEEVIEIISQESKIKLVNEKNLFLVSIMNNINLEKIKELIIESQANFFKRIYLEKKKKLGF